MAAKIYYKPEATIRKLTLPTGVGVETLIPGREGVRTVVDGRESLWTLSFGSRTIVRLELGPIRYRETSTEADFYARLWELSELLAQGGFIHFACDSTRTGLWPLRNSGDVADEVPAENASTIYLGTERLGLETSPALSVDDLAVVEEDTPGSRLWVSRISSWSGSAPITVGLASANHQAFVGHAQLRHHDFYPYLYRTEANRAADPFSFRDPGARVATWSMEFTMRLPEV